MINPEFSPLALEILKDRYLWKNGDREIIETPQGLLERVAREVAKAEPDAAAQEEYRQKFYDVMAKLDFLPNSPTLMNAGRPAPHGQLAACFVVGIEDSMESICGALRKQMLIHKTGGGTGFNFSALRPKNAIVNSTNGRASGPVSFMRLFDLSTEIVQQCGMRRGANMAILNADHPDIREFIACKDKEGKITNFNLSVGITDAFMERVLKYPYGEEAKLLEEIAEHAWKSGDPGLVFLDRLNEDNPCPQLGKIVATNPCVTGDTPILTKDGYRQIKDLVGKKVIIWNGESCSMVEPKVTGENQEVMTIYFSDGAELKCTPYHKFHIQKKYGRDGEKVIKKAEELVVGDKLCKTEYPVITHGENTMSTLDAYVNGFFTGDGTQDKRGHKLLRLYGEKKKLTELFGLYGSVGDISMKSINISLTQNSKIKDKYWIPENEYYKNRIAWLAGLIDADGHRNSKEGSVIITSIHRDFLLKIRLMLNTLGVPAHVLPLKQAEEKAMPDGHGGYMIAHCKTSYRLSISATNIKKLIELGLKTRRVNLCDVEPNRNAGRFVKVVKIERTGEIADKVYCFNEPKNHTGIFNGILTGNCGESPLLDGEACNLGSINLSHMYKNGKVDWQRLCDTIHIAVRMLDDIIEVGQYPLPEIEKAVKRTRKIGLGVMGWADLLYKLRIPYDSEEAVKLARKIMLSIKVWAATESIWLGAVKGVPDACEPLGRRNATVTCCAPTGTLALLADCSSGIEPVFSLVHTRTVTTVDGGTHDVKIFNPVYAALIDDKTVSDEEIQRVCKTAYDIKPIDHLKMQAAFQISTDLAVSKTVNMPNTATEQDVLDVYINAYSLHVKGVTIYRDGSKGTQVLTERKGALPEPKCSTC